jgi:hypothetical protein
MPFQKGNQAAKGHKPWNKGVPMTEEHKRKVSIGKRKNPCRFWKGKKFSEEHRENLSNAKKRKAEGNKSFDSHGYVRVKVHNHPFRDLSNFLGMSFLLLKMKHYGF